METMIDQRLSVAPMLDCTDRHARYLLRLISARSLLYTEMVVAQAAIYGDRQRLFGYSQPEQPLVLQLGGADPHQLAEAARIGEKFGYSQINLNVGCPSDRVQAGRFGAALMAEPGLVADLIGAMRDAVSTEVTVKSRIGIDDLDSWDHFINFVDIVARGGCSTFIVHARKAWLTGLSPRQNRTIPPLHYEFVHRLKQERPHLQVILNGGVTELTEVNTHLQQGVDGVMIGRAAYHNPWMLAEADRVIFGVDQPLPDRRVVLESYLRYMEASLKQGVPLRPMARHLIGFYQGVAGAKAWRRCIAEQIGTGNQLSTAGMSQLVQLIDQMERKAA